MRFEMKHLWGIIPGAILVIIAFLFMKDDKLKYFILAISAVIIALPFIVSIVIESGRQKEIEEKFLEFSVDLVENVKSGTPISKSIVNLRTRDYGKLTPFVEKLANQISLGIPLTQALLTFSNDTKNNVIARAVALITEAEKSGGQIDTILESVAKSVNQTENLNKERKSAVYSLVVQGYIIFFVFIIIMLVMEFKILPLTTGLGDIGDLPMKAKSINPKDFAKPLFILIITQSFFAGLVIGKISEGSIKDGLKHSFILIALALIIVMGARAFIG